jgi:hypothetical protein
MRRAAAAPPLRAATAAATPAGDAHGGQPCLPTGLGKRRITD